jgi:hypothetical protein
MPISLKLPKCCLYIHKRGLDGRGVLLVLRCKCSVPHLFVVEHSREPRPLVFKFPMFDEILNNQVKDRIVRRGNGPAHAGFPFLRIASRRKMARIFSQIVGQHLRPSRFLQSFLLRNASKVVVREDIHAWEIQPSGQRPYDFGRHVTEPALRCVIRENYPEEDRPLTAPVLADLVTDMDHIRRKASLYCVNRCLDLGLLCDRGGRRHLDSSLPLRPIPHNSASANAMLPSPIRPGQLLFWDCMRMGLTGTDGPFTFLKESKKTSVRH